MQVRVHVGEVRHVARVRVCVCVVSRYRFWMQCSALASLRFICLGPGFLNDKDSQNQMCVAKISGVGSGWRIKLSSLVISTPGTELNRKAIFESSCL